MSNLAVLVASDVNVPLTSTQNNSFEEIGEMRNFGDISSIVENSATKKPSSDDESNKQESHLFSLLKVKGPILSFILEEMDRIIL